MTAEQTELYTIRETATGLWELKHSADPDKVRWLFDTKADAEEKAGVL